MNTNYGFIMYTQVRIIVPNLQITASLYIQITNYGFIMFTQVRMIYTNYGFIIYTQVRMTKLIYTQVRKTYYYYKLQITASLCIHNS